LVARDANGRAVGFVDAELVGEGEVVAGGAGEREFAGREMVGEGRDGCGEVGEFGCQFLQGFDELGREAGVIEGEVAVGALGNEVRKNRLDLLCDEAGV
jgi:hypothetical protein